MADGLCRLCGEQRKLIDAHVIPRSFFKSVLDDSGYAMEGTNLPSSYPRKLPKGVYDPNILCADCETRFSRTDTHAFNVLMDRDWKTTEPIPPGDPSAYVIRDFDYKTLQLFFMSVLWRASESNQAFFRTVDLGPHEDRFRTAILTQTIDSVDKRSVCVSRFEGTHPQFPSFKPSQGFLNPHRIKFNDINFYQLYLADIAALVKVDQRPSPKLFDLVVLKSTSPLIVLKRSFRDCKELRVMHAVVRASLKQGKQS